MKLILAILCAITAAILVRRWLDWDKPIIPDPAYAIQVDPRPLSLLGHSAVQHPIGGLSTDCAMCELQVRRFVAGLGGRRQ